MPFLMNSFAGIFNQVYNEHRWLFCWFRQAGGRQTLVSGQKFKFALADWHQAWCVRSLYQDAVCDWYVIKLLLLLIEFVSAQ